MSKVQEFPLAEEWQEIYAGSPFPRLHSIVSGSCGRVPDPAILGIDAFAQSVSLRRLQLELHNRLVDAGRSYAFMQFFYSQGIPDQRWHVSPGQLGQSVQYFPDFRDEHFVVKGWFDFYADTFYMKIFSVWAIVGHILNVRYSLGLTERQVDFAPAVACLKPQHNDLAATLERVLADSAYASAKQLRNDCAHNEAPSSVGMKITRSETDKAIVYGLGMKRYVRSAEIIENATAVVHLLGRTLMSLREPSDETGV